MCTEKNKRPFPFRIGNGSKKGTRQWRWPLVFGAIFLLSFSAEAQCAMCRAVLQSEGNQETAEGINNGIVYLMAIPYVLVGVLFYFVYKKMRG